MVLMVDVDVHRDTRRCAGFDGAVCRPAGPRTARGRRRSDDHTTAYAGPRDRA